MNKKILLILSIFCFISIASIIFIPKVTAKAQEQKVLSCPCESQKDIEGTRHASRLEDNTLLPCKASVQYLLVKMNEKRRAIKECNEEVDKFRDFECEDEPSLEFQNCRSCGKFFKTIKPCYISKLKSTGTTRRRSRTTFQPGKAYCYYTFDITYKASAKRGCACAQVYGGDGIPRI